MLTRSVFTLLIVGTLAMMPASAGAAPAREAAIQPPDEITALIAGFRNSSHVRDSLSALVDSASGATREFLEEQIWKHQTELEAGVFAVAGKIKAEQSRGKDVTETLQVFKEALRREWPREMAQLRRRNEALAALSISRDEASGAERLAIESEMTRQADRLLQSYQSLADALRALDRIDIDTSEPRAFLVDELRSAAEGLVTRVQLANRDRTSASARFSRNPSSADLLYGLEATEERFNRATRSLSTAILLMNRLGLETTDLRVALIVATGRISTDVFKWKVFSGLLQTLGRRLWEVLAAKAPLWLFHGLLIALTFIGFRALSELVRRAVRQAVRYSQFSELMRGTIVRLSGAAVMLIGFIVILTQLGVHIAPLLAGLGIAGFAVGFAMQSTLANFAAGGMILGNQPFDIGDEIEVAGVVGVVKRMSLVSTTILTFDNQTLVVPNSTIWGGVIRNRTAQPIRRVDLTFGIGYRDDIERAEHVLREVVAAQGDVLKEPASVIKLHQLSDSSVIFVVRAWTTKEKYWDVYWDLTRAVKLRFDHEGITIPFPQREVHVSVGRSGNEGAAVTLGATPRSS